MTDWNSIGFPGIKNEILLKNISIFLSLQFFSKFSNLGSFRGNTIIFIENPTSRSPSTGNIF
jgi:hypothetical protein